MAALAAGMVESQTAKQKAAYPRMATAMKAFEADYTWEPVEFTTDDGYILTSFDIRKKDVEAVNPPVIFHHGNGWDAASWLQALQADGTPFPLDFAAKGFPVWMMNQRGTEFSKRHVRLDPSSKAYWNYDIFGEWIDIKANINIIKAYLGFDAYWYIGYSGATTQMIYALVAEEPFLRNKLRKSLLLAPCKIRE